MPCTDDAAYLAVLLALAGMAGPAAASQERPSGGRHPEAIGSGAFAPRTGIADLHLRDSFRRIAAYTTDQNRAWIVVYSAQGRVTTTMLLAREHRRGVARDPYGVRLGMTQRQVAALHGPPAAVDPDGRQLLIPGAVATVAGAGIGALSAWATGGDIRATAIQRGVTGALWGSGAGEASIVGRVILGMWASSAGDVARQGYLNSTGQ